MITITTTIITLAWYFCVVFTDDQGVAESTTLVGPFGSKPACEAVMRFAESKGKWVGACELMWSDRPMKGEVRKGRAV